MQRYKVTRMNSERKQKRKSEAMAGIFKKVY